MSKELYDIGDAPPLGVVPPKMNAWLIRPERFGEPMKGFQKEVVDVPAIKDDEVLVYIMAAGINYNNVWASLGIPVNVIKARNKQGEPEEFHIGGSDASGIVYKVGKDVTDWKVGDEVVAHCGIWDRNCPHVAAGHDPMYSPTFRIWGYETNYGSFAQFTKLQSHQLVKRPQHLSWEESAAYMLVGATAYRMLLGWGESNVQKNDVVLVWGASGGLGSMAIQIVKALGGIPIAVVSSEDKFDYCMKLGAKGCINRKDFDHWGMLPHWKDHVGYNEWLKGVRKFGKAIWDILGEKRGPRVVFEHPGEATIPTSIFVCETGGMVTICAGTSGYNATVDLRYLWMRQKRLQGSHFANDEQSYGFNELVLSGHVNPCLSKAYTYDEIPHVHQLMYENKHPHGNMAVLVGATEFDTGINDPEHRSKIDTAVLAADDVRDTPHVPVLDPDAEFTDEGDAKVAIPVTELMHKGLISCSTDENASGVIKKMLDDHIHAIVVVDSNNRPIGVISQTDIILASQGKTKEELHQITAQTLMTPGCITCDSNKTVSEAITLMTRNRIHRLVIVDNSGDAPVAIGVLSMTDIIAHSLA